VAEASDEGEELSEEVARDRWPRNDGCIGMAKKSAAPKTVENHKHAEAKRKNIPTAEHQSVLKQDEASPRTVKYPPILTLTRQLVWRGKDEQELERLVVHARRSISRRRFIPRR